MFYQFGKDHPMGIRAIRGGIVLMIGEWDGYSDHKTDLEWRWSGRLSLQFWLSTSMAGQVIAQLHKPMGTLGAALKGWEGGISHEERSSQGIAYVNWQSRESPCAETWAQCVFQPKGRFTVEMLAAGITTITGKHSERNERDSKMQRQINYEWRGMVNNEERTIACLSATYDQPGSISRPIYLRLHPDRIDLLSVISSWATTQEKDKV